MKRELATGSILMALTACAAPNAGPAGAPTELPSLPSETTATTSTTEAGPPTNERGHIIKRLGEEAGWSLDEADSGVSFSIDKVIVDPPCGEYGEKPESGHTLLLQVRVATGESRESASVAAGILNPYSFAEVGSDGITRDAQDGYCGDERALPHTFGINQKYAGVIELVVPEANGSLVLQQPSMENSAGWEWTYAGKQ